MPTVSVVLPTYNRVHSLEEAVQSVLDQSFSDLECIVVDGGSTDGTRAFLEAIDDDRLRVITRDRPRGLSNARNVAIERASGEHIVFLDDDDYLYENAIDVLVETLGDQPPECGGAYTAHRRVDESGHTRTKRVPDGRVDSYEDANIGGPSCTIVRTSVVEDVGSFDESFPAVEDSDFWIRLFSDYHMIAIDRVLYERRHRDGQMTNDPELMLAGCQRLLEKHGETFSPTGRARCHYSIAHNHARLDRTANARSHLRTAIRNDPWQLAYHYYHFWLLFGTPGYALGQTARRRILRPLFEELGKRRR